MERLTKRLHDWKVVTDCDSCEQKKDKQCTFSECRASLIKRLAAYEDIAALCGGLDRLRELAEADKNGRVVVPPCKVGDVVYGFHGEKTILPMVAKWIETNTDGWTVAAQYAPMAPKFFQFSDFGKTVFLTHEEAERAMEGKT